MSLAASKMTQGRSREEKESKQAKLKKNDKNDLEI